MANGRVKWWNDYKGFGFIVSASGEDVFVHHQELQDSGSKSLAEGQAVEFDVVQAKHGPMAVSVRTIGEARSNETSKREVPPLPENKE